MSSQPCPAAAPTGAATRPARRIAVGAAALAVLLPGLGTSAAYATTPSATAGANLCASTRDPALAARLSADIAAARSGRESTVAVRLWDTEKQLSCADNADAHFDSASVVKVTIMGAVLRRAEEEHRFLHDAEVGDLKLMIIKSDNDAATRLWDGLGLDRLQAFLKLAKANDTVLDRDRHWGLTQITANDEMKVLAVFASSAANVITPSAKAYGLTLMSQVQGDQRWGTPYGAPAGIRVQVKNGWAPRATHGWRINSLGVFTSPGSNYRMAVLTEDNTTKAYGVETIQRIAEVVHRDLNPAGSTASTTPSASGPEETSDGSTPYTAK